jgi:hypothetical protein
MAFGALIVVAFVAQTAEAGRCRRCRPCCAPAPCASCSAHEDAAAAPASSDQAKAPQSTRSFSYEPAMSTAPAVSSGFYAGSMYREPRIIGSYGQRPASDKMLGRY